MFILLLLYIKLDVEFKVVVRIFIFFKINSNKCSIRKFIWIKTNDFWSGIS